MQPVNETEFDFSDFKPIEAFEYPSQASKIVWDLKSNNILESSFQIIDFIKTNKISIQMAINFIDVFSKMRDENIELFTELYQKLSNAFSYICKPKNKKLATLLCYKGFKFENFRPIIKEDEILNLYSRKSPLFYIKSDKVDDLKSKFPSLYINQKINDEMTLLDCAIKCGSELCFNYLKNLGAKYTKNSEKYAVQGGNKNIFMEMIEDGKSFDKMINIALNYRQYEIAKYLKSNLGQTFNSIAESMYYGNYDVASYLLSNGKDINDIYSYFLFILIIVL